MHDPNENQPDLTADELPTTEALAAELKEIEEQGADDAPETVPVPADDGTDPADPETDPAPDETETPPGGTPATEPDPPDPPQDDPGDDQEVEVEAPARTIAPPVRSVHSDKKTADTARRRRAIADAPRPPDPSEADLEIQAGKDEIRKQMQLVQTELDETLDAAEACRDELKVLSAQLYPHMGESDHHVVAVRGYVDSQKKIRATRASSPEQIKRILEAAGRAPIDAAFQRQRARGMKRPTRTAVQPKPTGGDAAPGADKPKTDANAA